MSASTRQGALFGGRRRELQEFAQSGCPGVVHGRAHSHLDSLQIQVPRLTATAKDDAQKLVYFARDFLADRSRRFFSSGESTSGSDGRSWQICALTSRLCILEDLKSFPVQLKELASAGEPLNPEVIERVRAAWNITIRDGFGQTENVLLLGNFPGQTVKPGAVGKPSPGHRVVLLDVEGKESDDGEIAVISDPKPISLMVGYVDDEERTAQCFAGGYYRTGDVAHRDADGYFTYIGRADDVFKSSDYRLSPFEL